MTFWEKIRWRLVGRFGKIIFWIWHKSARITLVGQEKYEQIRKEGKPVIFLVWHAHIFIVPYFFRKRNIMPLISPSKDGEIPAQIMARWGYKILRGSGSHIIVNAWKRMIKELNNGGQVIIVGDGPRGPNRIMKEGGIKLAQKTGAYLVPFAFSSSRKKIFKSWDHLRIFFPFSQVITSYGEPFSVNPDLTGNKFEQERQKIENLLNEHEQKIDQHFN